MKFGNEQFIFHIDDWRNDISNLLYRVIKKNSICSRDGGFIGASSDVININGWFNLEHEYNNIGDLLSYVIVKEIAEKYYGIDIETVKTKRQRALVFSWLHIVGMAESNHMGGGFSA